MSKDIVASFKRNDVRIRKRIASKYGERRHRRINNVVHRITKDVVEIALKNKAIVLEEIKGIRKLYRRGNYQGRKIGRL